ncbi:hypothetical protein AAW51_2917 [Caldimonas brevitalea]|uniref:Uncharacterized protein n=1 Tax=Caldimonas brevitalea TaxID=413882 RepID=A0A0G3BNP1_9BURK|nr:hypothetical protein AAW51_2917 [Caldimonas brevitalea]
MSQDGGGGTLALAPERSAGGRAANPGGDKGVATLLEEPIPAAGGGGGVEAGVPAAMAGRGRRGGIIVRS